MSQYSQYKGTIVPTPQKSSPAAVNQHQNEPQGHGAVPIGQPVKLEERPKEPDTTTLDFGQAEPGRDIFGGHPHNELNSKESDATRQTEEEQKEASSQNVESATEAAKVAEEATEAIEAAESSTAEASSTVESSSADVASPASAEPEQTPAHVDDHEHAAGPKAEEEAEADRVRDALFPDAQAE